MWCRNKTQDKVGEVVFAVESTINDVALSQSACGVHDAGWVMIDTGRFCQCQSHGVWDHHDQTDQRRNPTSRCRRPLQGHGNDRSGCRSEQKPYEFRVADVTTPNRERRLLFCESGTEVRFNKQHHFENSRS